MSHQRIIEDSKETFYESLEASSAGWHEGEHGLAPWLEYSNGVLIAGFTPRSATPMWRSLVRE